jgi:hypothetical protein
MIILDANLVLTKVLSFQRGIPHLMQAFSHSYMLFPNFFVHVIVFYEVDCASFKLTCIMPLETLSSSLVAYRHTLNITCPKHLPS